MSCIFCKIASKEMETNIIYEDSDCIAFNDIKPISPKHILVIPKNHYENLMEVNDKEIMSKLFEAVKKIAKQEGLAKDGFRTVINTGDNGGQTVYHLHIHILGGRFHTWPPG